MTTPESIFDFPEDVLRECVQEMYPRIVASIDPKGYILDSLFAKGSITIPEKRRIGGLPEERGAELIDTLFTCQRPNALANFLEILSTSAEPAWEWIPMEVIKAAKEKVASTRKSPMGSERTSFQMNQDRGGLHSRQSQIQPRTTDMLDQQETQKYVDSHSKNDECARENGK